MIADSPPDTKSAKQNDEDVLRHESFKKGKKGKKKVIGERQKAHYLI